MWCTHKSIFDQQFATAHSRCQHTEGTGRALRSMLVGIGGLGAWLLPCWVVWPGKAPGACDIDPEWLRPCCVDI